MPVASVRQGKATGACRHRGVLAFSHQQSASARRDHDGNFAPPPSDERSPASNHERFLSARRAIRTTAGHDAIAALHPRAQPATTDVARQRVMNDNRYRATEGRMSKSRDDARPQRRAGASQASRELNRLVARSRMQRF